MSPSGLRPGAREFAAPSVKQRLAATRDPSPIRLARPAEARAARRHRHSEGCRPARSRAGRAHGSWCIHLRASASRSAWRLRIFARRTGASGPLGATAREGRQAARYALPSQPRGIWEYLVISSPISTAPACRDDPKGPLFRTIGRGTGKLTRTVLAAGERLCDDRRCAAAACIETKLGRQPQLPGKRDHRLSQKRRHARKGCRDGKLANHASTRTTQLYDRRRDEVSVDEVGRIVI